jgi:predicted Zn-dependent protease
MTSEAPAAAAASLFEQALQRYQGGSPLAEVLASFELITQQEPRLSAGWTCLAWLQLLVDQPQQALRSAKTAVRLNGQDPQARINLSLAMLETGAKGVRDHIEIVQRVIAMAPEMAADINAAIADGLQRKPGWKAMQKVKAWLAA